MRSCKTTFVGQLIIELSLEVTESYRPVRFSKLKLLKFYQKIEDRKGNLIKTEQVQVFNCLIKLVT